jgi:signal transduction histidine kinase
MQILPRRTYGVPLPPVSPLLPLSLTVWLAVVPIGIRKLARRERELAERDGEIRRQRELIDQVYLLNARFQEYALNAERKSAEEERKRITRDIHDIMGYTLVNLRVMLEVSLDLAGNENEKLSAHLSEAIRHTQEGLQSARKALRNLRAMEETGELWMNRVNRILTTFSGMTGVAIRVSWGNATYANCPRIKGAVYQFVQESLTNSFKHGEATEIDVDFSISGVAPDDRFLARVVDNGSGSKHVVPGIGFDGIRERVEQLDGSSGYRNLDGGFETWISIPMLSMRKDI